MMTMVSVVVFLAAFATAASAIALSVGPQWRRIARLATGHVEPQFAPVTAFAHAERRIAVRRRAATPAPAWWMRAAA